jgi:two-component system chemotaxis sensor kinase CheA
MSAVSDDITADFIIEAQEILDRLGEQLVSLEQAPQDSEQLNAVFRGYHTLKGGAGFLRRHRHGRAVPPLKKPWASRVPARPCCRPIHFDAAQQSLDYLQSMLDAGLPAPNRAMHRRT